MLYSLKFHDVSDNDLQEMRHYFNRVLPLKTPECFVSFGKILIESGWYGHVLLRSPIPVEFNGMKTVTVIVWSDEYIEQLQTFYHTFLWQHGINPLHRCSRHNGD